MMDLEFAAWGVLAYPLRSISTVVSIASAACCVIFCASIIGGFDETLRRLSFGDNAGTLVIRQNPLAGERSVPPSISDLETLRDDFPEAVAYSGWIQGQAFVRTASDPLNLTVYGVAGDYRRELDTELIDGRWLTSDEIEGNAKLCILGYEAAGEIGEGKRTGDTINVGGLTCEIVGILAFPVVRPAQRFSHSIVMPMGMARRYFVDPAVERRDLAWLTIFFNTKEAAAAARSRVDGELRKAHGIPQSRLSPYIYEDPDAQIADQERQRRMMSRLLASITGIILLVSIFSYSTTMLASSRSRAREFAIRLTVGAVPRDLVRQIVLENLILTCIGSGIGLGLGSALAYAATYFWDWPTMIHASLSAAVLGISLGVGGIIGGYAGHWAGSTTPAAAAR